MDVAWKEGIACSSDGKCPGSLTCCHGACLRECMAPADASADGASSCPAEVSGCFPCVPGCACLCGNVQMMCCLRLGVTACGGCP